MEAQLLDRITCPICGELTRPIGSVRTFIRAENANVTSDFAHCAACDFGFNSNPPSETRLAKYYQANDQLRRLDITNEEASHISGQVEFLAPYLPTDAFDILEIGPDNPTFLKEFRRRFPLARCSFSELNPEARRSLTADGFDDATENNNRAYAAIVMRHVFEHIENPVDCLTGLRDNLCEGGVMLIEVPDCTSFGDRATDDFQYEHINYFSTRAMMNVADRAGFLIESMKITRTANYSTTPNHVMRLILRKGSRDSKNDHASWCRRVNRNNSIYHAIDEISFRTPRTAIYGAGGFTAGYASHASATKPNISAIYDADAKKIGTLIMGVPIQSPEKISAAAFDMIVVTVLGYEQEVVQQILAKGVPRDRILTISQLRDTHRA